MRVPEKMTVWVAKKKINLCYESKKKESKKLIRYNNTGWGLKETIGIFFLKSKH